MTRPDQPRPDGPHRFLVTTAAGLEGVLEEELRELGLDPEPTPAGPLVLNGGWEEAAKVLVRSRVASRLLLSIRRFAARHRAMLYDQVRRVDWPRLFPPSRSIVVHAFGDPGRSDFNLAFAPLRIKDAICDEFRSDNLDRPDVDRRNPDARIVAYFFRGRCELSLDLSGEPLHRRGYRQEGGEAPLRENRAAALLRFAGYDGSAPLVDPFCGSGTVAIEAAMMATGRAPGLLRRADAYAAAKLFPESAGIIRRERDSAAGSYRGGPAHPIRGFDVSRPALATAQANAAKAGMEDAVRFERRDARDIDVPAGWIVSNPPYGERLEDQETATDLLREFVHQVKHHAVGTRMALVLPRGPVEKAVGLRPARRLAVESGSLGLRYLFYEVYAGSRKGSGAES